MSKRMGERTKSYYYNSKTLEWVKEKKSYIG